MAIIQTKVAEWILILAALAVIIALVILLFPAISGPTFFQNPGVVR